MADGEGAAGPRTRAEAARRAALALVAGAATVFAFAPFDLAWLPVATLGTLFALWQGAASARSAAALGFAFGLGLFGAGASWVLIALHRFGGMPLALAAAGTFGFCAFLALYPAAVGWLAVRWTSAGSWRRALAAPALWSLAEYARSVVFTGFPWLSLGYAELPLAGPAPLAGYAPVAGVFGVTLAVVLVAAAFAALVEAIERDERARAAIAIGAGLAVVGGGAALARVEWTEPSGPPLAVSLVQGNITQELKFDPEFRRSTFEIYVGLVAASRGRLVVLPESAFPLFADEVPPAIVEALASTAAARGGDVLVGLFTEDPPVRPGGGPRYYNSVASVGASPPQLYRKRHLVPFGESIPLEPVVGWVIRNLLSIPISSQARGVANPPPFRVAGERVAVDICYEDAFGADIRPQAAGASLLVNVTNDAWYGRSLAARQHNQIAAMRALETGRALLRATNTGITSAIGHDGREIARLPWFTRGILEVDVAGRSGLTPYVRFGDGTAAGAAALLAVVALARRRPGRRGS